MKHSYQKLEDLKEYSENTPFNREEIHDTKIGIVCSGCSYYFAKEVFGDDASYYKIGFVNPLPIERIRAFAKKVDKVYVIEETDPLIENEMRLAGIECTGKDILPVTGELLPDVLREKFLGITYEPQEVSRDKILSRPPSFCAGCPHRHPRNLRPLHCWRSAAPGSRCLAGRRCAVHRTRRPAVRCAVRRPTLLPVYTMKYRNQL